MRVETLEAPDYWSSYLINGDASSLEAEDIRHADLWLEENGVDSVVDCAEEPRFTRHYRLYNPHANCASGSVLEYTVYLP
jgi:hypothetical protein